MTILAIETSCDETAVAVLRDAELVASEIASQAEQHEKFGGVVPEVASRNHLLHAPRLLERVTSQIPLSNVDAFAATSGPGLASSLMVGASIAKALAIGFAKPYLAINHLEGHLLSPFFGGKEIEPNVSLIVSGGHTLLVKIKALGEYAILGRTVDDAAGEAFDKVAKMLGLGYPGGPEIERHALDGDPRRFDLPRSMLDSRDHNFSFSGLKTAVRYLLPKVGANDLNDVCASFQCAVIDVLVTKTVRAARECRSELITISGGVSCNRALREAMQIACHDAQLELRIAQPGLCTDNAAMIAFVGWHRLRAGLTSPVSEEINPNLSLAA
ncbi:MAG: tRNA (adenosine(37)-N6)-threonylcarbamoyltransferase complex transferase subunit TsaD [Chthoniobacterales bacterium]